MDARVLASARTQRTAQGGRQILRARADDGGGDVLGLALAGGGRGGGDGGDSLLSSQAPLDVETLEGVEACQHAGACHAAEDVGAST